MSGLRGLRTGAAVTLLAAVTACAGSSPSSGGTTTPPPAAAVIVDIRNIAFNPRTVTIHSGQTVAWKFHDGTIVHNVVGSDWRSPDRTSGYYTHVFTTPGTYAYRCTIHANMDGQVVVAA